MNTRTREYVFKASQLSALVGLAMSLSGCIVALPPMVQIASLALDGVSYAATGKSVTDHAISTVTNKDCAVLRGFKGQDICTEKQFELALLPDGTPAPMADDAAKTVTTAEQDKHFQIFSAKTDLTGDDSDESYDASQQELDALDMTVASGPML